MVGGAGDAGVGGEVEEGGGLADAVVGGVLEGQAVGADALVESGIPDVVGRAGHAGLGEGVQVSGGRADAGALRGGDGSGWAADLGGPGGGGARWADTTEGGLAETHALGAAGEAAEGLVGEGEGGDDCNQSQEGKCRLHKIF